MKNKFNQTFEQFQAEAQSIVDGDKTLSDYGITFDGYINYAFENNWTASEMVEQISADELI